MHTTYCTRISLKLEEFPWGYVFLNLESQIEDNFIFYKPKLWMQFLKYAFIPLYISWSRFQELKFLLHFQVL